MATDYDFPDRQSPRDKVILPIALVANAEGEPTLIPASTLDFSSDGLRIQATIRLSIGELIQVQFDHDPTDLRQYRVVWTKAGNGWRPGQAGLRTLKPSANAMMGPIGLSSNEPELDAT